MKKETLKNKLVKAMRASYKLVMGGVTLNYEEQKLFKWYNNTNNIKNIPDDVWEAAKREM